MITPASVRDVESEAEIAAFLAGAPRRPRTPSSFAYAAARHGVAPLLVKAGVSAWLPGDAAAPLVAEARRQAVLAVLRDRQLGEALQALDREGVPALVMKGAALAHTLYAEPHLRPRQDSDLLIRACDRRRAVSVLCAAGYRLERGATNRDALGQMLLDKRGSPGAALDVHWQAAAVAAAAAWFDVEALLARSVPLPALGAAARGLGPADALALACVHLAAHHPGHEMLLWWYDIHLLVGALDDEERGRFIDMTRERGMARVCLDGVASAGARFASPRSADLARRLRELAEDEPSAPLLGRRRKLDDLRLDLATLGWRRRMALLRAHLFPPAEYMRHSYAPHSGAPLPWLYLTRIARGARKWRREPEPGRAGKDVQWVPSPQPLVDKMLDLASVTPEDYVMDLGSGDGRTVIAAARRGARAIGIEYDQAMVELSKQNAVNAGVSDRTAFERADLFDVDLSKATVITIFLGLPINLRLWPKLLDLEPGTRIVSNTYPMEDWAPDAIDEVAEGGVRWNKALLWIVPAKIEGAWKTPKGELELTRKFQMVSGSLGAAAITEGRLRGDVLTFTAGGTMYEGRVTGNAIGGNINAVRIADLTGNARPGERPTW